MQQVLRESGFEELLSSGVVLTGGSAVMQGMVELGEEIFHMPVRIGVPRYAGALAEVLRTPRYATAMGLSTRGREGAGQAAPARLGQGRSGAHARVVPTQFLRVTTRQGENNNV